MTKSSALTVVKFGVFAIIVASSLGCSTAPYRMESRSLDYFVVDCSKKAEQLAFIESQRLNKGQKVNSGLYNYFTPWRQFTDPDGYRRSANIASGHQNWLLDQILFEIARCPR